MFLSECDLRQSNNNYYFSLKPLNVVFHIKGIKALVKKALLMLLPKEEQELLTVFYLTVHALHDLYVTLSMENNLKQLFT